MKPHLENQIDRIVVCQAFLDARGRGNYLEIGVSRGTSFMAIKASAKWGVDPMYALPLRQRVKYRLGTALGWKEARLFRMTSDDFFRRQGGLLARRGVDVALVDGLHTYEQTLRDVLHTLEHLKPGGVIVLHDCNPLTEAAAYPGESYDAAVEERLGGENGIWNGDVWKVIVHLRALRADLATVVLDCDHGVGVVQKKPGGEKLTLSVEEIRAMTYADLDGSRQELLGLRTPAYLEEMVAGVAARRG